MLERREDPLLVGRPELAEDVGRVVVVELLDDLRRLLRGQRRERRLGVLLLWHLGQRLARELGRQGLHGRQAVLLVQSGEDVGEVGGLELVGAADEGRDLARPHQVDHPPTLSSGAVTSRLAEA